MVSYVWHAHAQAAIRNSKSVQLFITEFLGAKDLTSLPEEGIRLLIEFKPPSRLLVALKEFAMPERVDLSDDVSKSTLNTKSLLLLRLTLALLDHVEVLVKESIGNRARKSSLVYAPFDVNVVNLSARYSRCFH